MSSTLSPLDSPQVLRDVHDPATHSLRTTGGGGGGTVIVDQATSSIKIGDGTDLALVTPTGDLQVINMGQLVPKEFDYISATYPLTTQEVYVYKTGGSGGATVATITINYVDATKAQLLDVTRT